MTDISWVLSVWLVPSQVLETLTYVIFNRTLSGRWSCSHFIQRESRGLFYISWVCRLCESLTGFIPHCFFFPQHLEKCLDHSRCLINIIEKIDEQVNAQTPPRSHGQQFPHLPQDHEANEDPDAAFWPNTSDPCSLSIRFQAGWLSCDLAQFRRRCVATSSLT